MPLLNAQPNNFIVVITTCLNDEEATRLANKLIENRLAACVQSSRIKSVYRWQGVIETSDEVRLMIKARAEDYQALESLIQSTHSYATPEILALPVVQGLAKYLDWIDEETAR